MNDDNDIPSNKLTLEQAKALLCIRPPRPESSDKREHVEFVYAQGPYGDWPEPLSDVLTEMDNYQEWWFCASFRCGHGVYYDRAWGYQANQPEPTDCES